MSDSGQSGINLNPIQGESDSSPNSTLEANDLRRAGFKAGPFEQPGRKIIDERLIGHEDEASFLKLFPKICIALFLNGETRDPP